MKKFFLALMAVAAIAIVGCNGHHVNEPDDPEAPENGRDRNALISDSNGANQSSKVPTRMYLPETQSAK